jgi:hypothetical protein
MKNFTKKFCVICFCISLTQIGAVQSQVTESFRSNLYVINPDNSLALADGNLAQYNNSFSAAVDNQDIVKLTNLNETFGLLRDNILLAIERRPIIGVTDTLFFSLTKTTPHSYQFQFTATALNHPGLSGILEDSYTGINTPVNLNGTTAVNFSVTADVTSQNPTRFMVVFVPSTPTGITPVHFSSVTAEQKGKNAEVSWNVDDQLNIKEYAVERSTDGSNFVQVATVNATGSENSSSQYAWLDATATSGNYFYRIKSIGVGGELLYSQVVNVTVGTASQSLTIYPNPVMDGIINLRFNNMPEGIYNVQVTTLSGQQVAKEVVNNSGENSSQNITLGKNINKGVYQLEIIGPDNSKTFLKVLNY